MKPLVSILIPTYNQEQYISQAIDSALQQTYSNKEIIIGDDQSSDNTYQEVAPYLDNEHIQYVYNTPNKGRVNNYRHLLYNHADGKYVINLDGDDFFYDSKYIEEAVKTAEEHQLALVFAKKATLIESSHKKNIIFNRINSNLSKVLDGNELFLQYPNGNVCIPHLSGLYLKSEAHNIGFYTHDIISSDWESLLRLILGNNVGFIDTYAGVWRKHVSNESGTLSVTKIMENSVFIDSVVQYAEQNQFFSQDILRKWRSDMQYRYFMKYVVKSLLLNDPEHQNNLQKAIYDYDSALCERIYSSVKLKGLKLVSSNRFFLHVIFKYVIKQESMLTELRLSQQRNNAAV